MLCCVVQIEVFSKSANSTSMASMDLQSSLDRPAMIAPPGIYYNFVYPSKLNIKGRAVCSVCLVLSYLAVGMRLWTKARVLRKVFLEDCDSSHHFSSLRNVMADSFQGYAVQHWYDSWTIIFALKSKSNRQPSQQIMQ